VPGVACGCEDASCLKHEKSEVFDCIVGQGITTSDGDVLDFMKVLPQCFNGIIWCPDGGNAGAVDLQLSVCDGAIVGVEMHDHCHHGDIGKAKCVIVKFGQV